MSRASNFSSFSGISTEKMHNGHRGINHPIKNLITNKCEYNFSESWFCC